MANAQPPIGIDLGTTFSVIAYLDATGRPQTIPNAEGDLTTPSVVFFEDGVATVGKEATKAATMEPDRIAQFVKREVGKPLFSKTIEGQQYPPEVIQSLILAKLKRDAEEVVGPIKDVVITVPAFFTEPRRKATQDAGRLAGMRVLDIINEPTAAAIAYGVQKGFLDPGGAAKNFERILIYDLGGGTFDATIMTIEGKEYKVVATDGDVKLGGIDWDRKIADLVAEEFIAKHGSDPRQDPAGLQRLLRDAEDAKRALTARAAVNIACEHRGQACKVQLTRDKFADLTASLLERTRYTVASLLEEAGVGWSDITRLLLVGGSTRMPMVAEMLEADSGKKVDRSLSADESVAHGAAVYAGLLASNPEHRFHDLNVTNVNSHSLGVLAIERDTRRSHNDILIPKNTPLPFTFRRRYRLSDPNQKTVEINVIEGEDASGHNVATIGRCIIRDLPGNLPEAARVIVAFTYEPNGRLTVHASIPGIQNEAHSEIERASGMSESAINEWTDKLAGKHPALPIVDDSARALHDQRAGENELLLGVGSSAPCEAEGIATRGEVESLGQSLRASWQRRDLDSCLTYGVQLLACPAATDADKFVALLFMGLAYMENGQADTDAVDALESAIQIDHVNPEALSALAQCYVRVARYEDALTTAKQCLAVSPDDQPCRQLIADFERR